MSIREIVQHTLAKGYLTLEAENRLRLLLQKTKYGLEEINAFMSLQEAAMAGQVRQESRELIQSQHSCSGSSLQPSDC